MAAAGKTAVQGSKRYRKAAELVDPEKNYPIEEAVALVKQFPPAKFDETVEIAVRLGIDLKKQEGGIRGTLVLPNGVGKEKRVVAFAEGDAAEAARASGALEVGGAELVQKVLDGWTDFDVAVAHPAMMRHVGKLGRVLGPKGTMPSPKSGTVTEDVGTAVREFRAGKLEYRTDTGGNVHAPVGKRSFAGEKLVQNIRALLEHLGASRPAAAKGSFVRGASISTTMGPGVALAV